MAPEITREAKASPPSVTLPEARTKGDRQREAEADLARLRFPQQPFLDSLNKENLPSRRSDGSLPVYMPEDTRSKETPPKETETYLITDADNGRLRAFRTKARKDTLITVTSPDGTDILRVNFLPQIANDTLSLVQHQLQIAPTAAAIDPHSGNLSFRGEDGKDYLASPNFVLRETGNAALLERFTPEIEKVDKEIETIRSTKRPYDNIRALNERIDELREERMKLLKEVLGDRFRDFTQEDLDRLPADEKKRLSGLMAERTRLEEDYDQLMTLRQLNERRSELQEIIEKGRCYEGQLQDGTTVMAFQAPNGDLEFCDQQGHVRYEEIYNGHMISSASILGSESFLQRITHRADGETITVDHLLSRYPHPTSIEYKGGPRDIDISEVYEPSGELSSRQNGRTGVIDNFADGKYSHSVIVPRDAHLALEHSVELQQHPQGEQLIKAAAEKGFSAVLRCYQDLKRLPYFHQVLEAGLKPLDAKGLHELRYELQSEMKGGGATLLADRYRMLSATDRQDLDKMLQFRIRMLEDGLALSRKSYATDDHPGIATQLWNDPQSRGYFEIGNDWIDWKEPAVAALVDQNDPTLSQKELKLLAARTVFEKGQELTPETVREALHSLAALRNQYKDVELFKSRNVVMAAHSDTLVGEYSGNRFEIASGVGDFHDFAKRELVAGIRAQQGNEGTFSLFRAEPDALEDLTQVETVVRAELDQEAAGKVLNSLKGGKAPFSLLDVDRALQENQVESSTHEKILQTLRGPKSQQLAQLKQVKQNLLETMVNTPPPFTFVFDGHGGPDSLYLSDGRLGRDMSPTEAKTTIQITADELAGVMRARGEKYGFTADTAAEQRDVLIFQNCYNHNFVRRMNQQLDGMPVPISVGASEYNQLSLFLHPDPAGALFLSEVVGAKKGSTSNLGSVIERQLKDLSQTKYRIGDNEGTFDGNTNPSIVVPDADGKPRQISALFPDARGSLQA
jgi:hypothetical protein